MGPSDEAITASLARLDSLQASSTQRVAEFKSNAEEREAKRRDLEADDDLKRDELVRQSNELQESDKVAAGWAECKAATNAQDLCELLKKQNEHCGQALSKLDDIAKQLNSQLRHKDHEYVSALKRNRQEIELLQSCIEREHGLLKDAFEKELQLIKESLNADKASILQARQNELDALMRERNNVEVQSLESQLRTIDKQRSEIKSAEATCDADASALQEKLEAELQKLKIQLEDTRARRQFESDKLEFDVRVLDELSDNNAELKKQKLRIMKGKEELNKSIEAKHREQERGAKENQILEDDCERIERQSNGLKEKFERFKISDNDKFRAILALHKDDLQQLQDELDRSQDIIFGDEIGCYPNEDISCISNPSQSNDISSVLGNGERKKLVDFGLLDDTNDNEDVDATDEWQQAEILMSNYKDMLEKREELQNEVKQLADRSDSLEGELRARLSDEVNEDLAFPPSDTISVGDEEKK